MGISAPLDITSCPMTPLSARRLEISDWLIAVSGMKASDAIVVLGARHIDTLLDLARRGFSQVTCRDIAATGAVEPVRVVLIPGIGQLPTPERLLARINRWMPAGGTVVLQDSSMAPSALQDRLLRDTLPRAGFVPVETARRQGSGLVLIARKLSAAGTLARSIAA